MHSLHTQTGIRIHCIPTRVHSHHGMHHKDIRITVYPQGGICIIAYLQGYIHIMACTIKTFASRHTHKGTLASWHIAKRTFASWHTLKQTYTLWHASRGHLHHCIPKRAFASKHLHHDIPTSEHLHHDIPIRRLSHLHLCEETLAP